MPLLHRKATSSRHDGAKKTSTRGVDWGSETRRKSPPNNTRGPAEQAECRIGRYFFPPAGAVAAPPPPPLPPPPPPPPASRSPFFFFSALRSPTMPVFKTPITSAWNCAFSSAPTSVASFRFLPSVARYMQQGAPAIPSTRGTTGRFGKVGGGVRGVQGWAAQGGKNAPRFCVINTVPLT